MFHFSNKNLIRQKILFKQAILISIWLYLYL